jgi:hypothetical protein
MKHEGCKTGSRRGTRRRLAGAAIGLTAAAALALAGATAAQAASPGVSNHRVKPASIKLVVITPRPGDVAGAGGVFNVDVAFLARNATGNRELSAANGYVPGINATGLPTFGVGKPDPFAPGLVVTLSTTPTAAGGPRANLAGVFQLSDVALSYGRAQVFADWQVGKAGLFGESEQTTLTVYLVRGTAPGMVTGSSKPISNVVRETFTIGG